MLILVADDIPDARHVMRLLLEMKGHDVLEASNGRQAVECALSDHPDLILMDMSMPVMDGLVATRRIREHAETTSIPIIALSAHMGDAAWRNRAIESGCNDCFCKPLDFDALDRLMAVVSNAH